MRQFVVPQFIQVENKIIGFITARQFVILLGALLISVAFYKFADITLFIFLTVIDFGIAIMFGWGKVNGRPIHYFLLNLFSSVMNPNQMVWGKKYSDIYIKELMEKNKDKDEPDELSKLAKMGESRLSELSLIVDTGGRYQGKAK